MGICLNLAMVFGLVLLATQSTEGAVVCIQTGTRKDADTDSHVYIQLEGPSGGKTQEVEIDTPYHDDFESGEYWCYTVALSGISKVKKVHLRMVESGAYPGWDVEYVTVYYGHQHYKAIFNTWLSSQGKYKLHEVRNAVFDPAMYTICFKTGNVGHAGTASGVFVRLHTNKGMTGFNRLKTSGGFWTNTERCFDVHSNLANLGVAQYVDVKIDGKGDAPAWYVEDVQVGTNGHSYVKGVIHRWIEAHTPVVKLKLH